MRRNVTLVFLFALLAGLFPATGAQAAEEGVHSPNMTHVKRLEYAARNGTIPNYGTDIEFAEIGGREYAFAGSYRNGLQIVNITKPEEAKIVAVYDCGVTQGDVQVFRRDDLGGRTFVTYTSDTYGDGKSTCYNEAHALGFDVRKANGSGKNGTFIVDVSDPLHPSTVSFVEVPKGSHNQTVHPSGKFLYNSNSDLITSVVLSEGPAIEVYDITDITSPELATKLALPIRPGLGTESHDITFNKSGTRAYSAALSQGIIINTEKPAEPSIITSFVDPAINVWHQSDPFTLTQGGEKRDFLIVEDEVAGALPTFECPSGGVHIYDITGENEKLPVKVGYWNIDEVRPTTAGHRCTAHVFDIHEKEAIMTIAFYNAGVRVVDISNLVGISLGDTSPAGGMKELGFYRFTDSSDTWAAKTPKIHPRTGDFYLYGNDVRRGLDIYKFSGSGKPSKNKGRWMTPKQAEERAAGQQRVALTPETAFFCLRPQE